MTAGPAAGSVPPVAAQDGRDSDGTAHLGRTAWSPEARAAVRAAAVFPWPAGTRLLGVVAKRMRATFGRPGYVKAAFDRAFTRIGARTQAVLAKSWPGATVVVDDQSPLWSRHCRVDPRPHEFLANERRRRGSVAPAGGCLPKLVLALRLAMAADAVNILSLNGAAGGQTVFHLHSHLIPVHNGRPVLRRDGRRVTFQFVRRPAPREEIERGAEEIRAHLPGRRRARRTTRRDG